jgi:glycosyltransferase involved in cell wall biosynthesis
MPLVTASGSSAVLHLVGRDPSEQVNELGNLSGVEVIGPVEDMADALSRASVYVCPMVTGTGIKNKLLEALANGLPCVASRLAVRGMNVSDGVEVLIADAPADVADAVLRLLGDDDLRSELGRRGRAYVTANHTWAGMAGEYADLYRSLMAD